MIGDDKNDPARFERRRVKRTAADIEDQKRVAAAFVEFSRLYLDKSPHAPEDLRIIETPLGFAPK